MVLDVVGQSLVLAYLAGILIKVVLLEHELIDVIVRLIRHTHK